MKYVKPDLEIVEFEDDVTMTTQVGGSDVSDGFIEDNTEVGDDLWGMD